MKRIIGFTLMVLMLVVFSLPAFADTTVNVDGKTSILPTINHQDRVLIPLRDSANLLGAEVTYLSDVQLAFIKKNDIELRIKMGDALSYLNNKEISSGVPPVVVEGKAYVPLRFLAESLNYEVSYTEGLVQLESKPLAKIHFIDVGFGDAIYIQLLNDKNILIDAGDKRGGGTVATYLRNQGVKEIDLVVATKTASEHMGGLASVFRSFKVKQVIDTNTASTGDFYKEYKEELSKYKIPCEPANKQTFEMSGVTFSILSTYGQMINQDPPTKTIVSSLTVGNQNILFMSDRTGQREVSDLPSHTFKILKVSDHAGIDSTSQQLLNLVKPEVAIVTSDQSVPGYPKGTVLQRISDTGAKLYSTGTNGNIVVETNGQTYKVIAENNQQIEIVPEKEHDFHIITGLEYSDYLGDKRTNLYHHPACEEAKQIPQEDRIWFLDKIQAEENGFTPDELCRPE
ncbi:stalk domain-containing protein [Desulforamulus aeronauticus]|uniref:Metal-dependent hydrolase, beta-lactamase superfamily II n=1 Tax=Desulforamulus aeronauticus DSM 10349 TaxID=1121421 RepID=A0A1M6T3M2_9FIRM|nr:stalk domain-containing protein [Desulforamulus aeronauticus]SHK51613.1 Metal-dependent hydrolase, beta-lactamase superfamily II [Desulforamulus aeronauticus DSM 10349]